MAVRKMTLAGVLAMLPVAACSQAAQDADLNAKAEQAEKAAKGVVASAETEIEAETADVEAMLADAFGPVAGEAMPVDTLVGTGGETINRADLVGTNGGVVIFSRSMEWCPYCQKQALELVDAVESLDALNMKLTLVTYDAPVTLSEFQTQHDLGYQFASDTGSTTIKAANLYNAEMPAGTKYDGVPHPAVIVLDAGGYVQDLHVDTDYKIRPTVADVIAKAEAVANAG